MVIRQHTQENPTNYIRFSLCASDPLLAPHNDHLSNYTVCVVVSLAPSSHRHLVMFAGNSIQPDIQPHEVSIVASLETKRRNDHVGRPSLEELPVLLDAMMAGEEISDGDEDSFSSDSVVSEAVKSVGTMTSMEMYNAMLHGETRVCGMPNNNNGTGGTGGGGGSGDQHVHDMDEVLRKHSARNFLPDIRCLVLVVLAITAVSVAIAVAAVVGNNEQSSFSAEVRVCRRERERETAIAMAVMHLEATHETRRL